jgi:tetratricopeptide (TPR) repeat protein
LREKIRSNPQDTDALFLLAEMYERAGLFKEEIDTLQKVVALKPDMGYAWFKMGTNIARFNLGMAYLKAGQQKERTMTGELPLR